MTDRTSASAAVRLGSAVFRVWLTAALIAVIASWSVYGSLFILKGAFGVEGRQVLTASMEPFMPVGSYVFASEPMGGDLVVGKPVVIETDEGVTYTHRIIQVVDGVAATKGDNSDLADLFEVRQPNIVGIPQAVVRGPWAVALNIMSDIRVFYAVNAVLMLTLIGQATVNSALDRRDRRRYDAYRTRITSDSTAESQQPVKEEA